MTKRKKRPQQIIYKRFKKACAQLLSKLASHPILCSLFVSIVYLVVFQGGFLFSGDVWAETHMEYLEEAIHEPYSSVFQPGWAGYWTIVPSLLTKIYVALQLPLGYIDFYFKSIVVLFVISCVAFFASKMQAEGLHKNLPIRLIFGLAILLLLFDKSTFTFINVWYLGFIPIIVLCLNHVRLSVLQQVGYTIFGVLMALTKPSLILIPFTLYRGLKTKEYISNGLVLAAAVLQTLVMLFFDPKATSAEPVKDPLLIAQAVFTGGGAELYKLFQIVPPHFVFIILANIILIGLFIAIIKYFGWLRASLLAFGYTFSVYSYILAPDAMLYKGSQVYSKFTDFNSVYQFNFKVQRELLIYVFLVLIIIFALTGLYPAIKKRIPSHRRTLSLILTILIGGVALVQIYRPIDVESAGVAANIDGFRHSMNIGQTACVPIPPTPYYLPNASWVYASNTELCHARNFDLNPDFENMSMSFAKPQTFTIPNDLPFEIKTVYLVVKNDSPKNPTTLTLTEKTSDMQFLGRIPARNHEKINFIPINVAGLPFRENYTFTLSSDSQSITWGWFKDSKKPLYYPYFAPTSPAYIRTR